AVILGENAVARALERKLAAQGATVHRLAVSDDIDRVLVELERAWESGPAPHLFLLAAWDADAVTDVDGAAWNRRLTRGVMLPYLVCQKWHQLATAAGIVDQSTVIGASVLGGDFGFTREGQGAEGGAINGLIKALYLETGHRQQDKFRCKVVD